MTKTKMLSHDWHKTCPAHPQEEGRNVERQQVTQLVQEGSALEGEDGFTIVDIFFFSELILSWRDKGNYTLLSVSYML